MRFTGQKLEGALNTADKRPCFWNMTDYRRRARFLKSHDVKRLTLVYAF